MVLSPLRNYPASFLNMKNKRVVLLLFVSLLLETPLVVGTPVLANSGACSYHKGVNCAAGPGVNGQVICNDGWTGSSVSYDSMLECQIGAPTLSGGQSTPFELKQKCASYTGAIQDQLLTLDAGFKVAAKANGTSTYSTAVLDEVFYSPVANSCLYTETFYGFVGSQNIAVAPDLRFINYSINDYLDNDSQVYTISVDQSASIVAHNAAVDTFNRMVRYYKGSPAKSDNLGVVLPGEEPAASAAAPSATPSGDDFGIRLPGESGYSAPPP